jgi:hypothetical protein
MVGMVAAKVFIMFIDSGAVSAGESSYSRSSILVTAAQVSAVQLSGLVGPLTQETPRATKVIALGAFVVVGVVWAVISALIAGRGSREE